MLTMIDHPPKCLSLLCSHDVTGRPLRMSWAPTEALSLSRAREEQAKIPPVLQLSSARIGARATQDNRVRVSQTCPIQS